MTAKNIKPSSLGKLRVMILASDNDFGRHLSDCMANAGVLQVEYAESLNVAMASLRRHSINIIVADIHTDQDEGLMLPCMVSELNAAGRLHSVPHIIWTGGQSEQWAQASLKAGAQAGWRDTLHGISMTALLSHARLAKAAGVQVEIAWESSTECLLPILEHLSEVATNPPLTSINQEASIPTDDEVVIALSSGEGLRVVYQPQYHLHNKVIVGAEALIRWNHPSYGDVPPSVLIPMVNQLGLDLLLFSYIEKNVIDTLVSLNEAGIELPLAVNASARTICAPGLAARLAKKMRSAGVPPSRLKIELTEDVPPDSELSLSASIMSLRSKGFPVSLDDFGAGAATLALLAQMPFDEMKIDGALVRAVGQTANSRSIISGVVELARSFNLTLITEGIEDESTVSLLSQLGCEVGQGYALAHPMEMDDFLSAARAQCLIPTSTEHAD